MIFHILHTKCPIKLSIQIISLSSLQYNLYIDMQKKLKSEKARRVILMPGNNEYFHYSSTLNKKQYSNLNNYDKKLLLFGMSAAKVDEMTNKLNESGISLDRIMGLF